MARLPQPGSDKGTWGDVLNEYLSQTHKPDGTLKDNSVTANVLAPDSVTSTAIANDAVNAAQIADGTITSAQIADDTIVAADISASAGITKTQLAAGVQASLDKADTALQSGASASGSLSGFPLRKAGETSVAAYQELANAFAPATAPVGAKKIVLAESWGKPGVLKHIWIACGNTSNGDGFLEQGGIIRIYTDDSSTPAVSMTLGDFFFLSNHSNVFATPRVGRTNRGGGDESAAYRYIHMPFQKYLRVEVENTTSSNTVFYGTADYSTVASFGDLGSQQLAYTIKGQRDTSHAIRTPMTICDMAGAGQVESLMVSFAGADGDAGVLEGNVEIYIDNEEYPSWVSSGMEDAFNGGWYTVPVGGYPAGKSGSSSQSGENHTLYRFFIDDPVFFSSNIKIVVWAGQPNQASVVSSDIIFAGYAGIWLNTPTTPNYKAVDMVTAPILNDQLSQAAGTVNSSDWSQDGGKTQAVATGSSFTVPYGSAGADQDVRLGRLNVALPSDYWLETRLRITDPSHDNQEAHLAMLGATPNPWFGSAIHLQLKRNGQYLWQLTVRDDFDTAFVVVVGSGRDLTNTWVRLAFKKEGTDVTAYYSFSDNSTYWTSIGKWTPTKTDIGFGLGTWTAGAEFDYLVVRPLESINS